MKVSGPIQPNPLGLLGLLQLKNLGRNPAMLQDEVSPSIDLLDQYLQGQSIGYAALASRTIAAATPSSFVPFNTPAQVQVPDGELWWVENLSVAFASGVGGTLTGGRMAYQNFNGQTFILGDGEVNLAAAQNRILSARRFWLLPGSLLGFFYDAVTVSTASFTMVGMQYATLLI